MSKKVFNLTKMALLSLVCLSVSNASFAGSLTDIDAVLNKEKKLSFMIMENDGAFSFGYSGRHTGVPSHGHTTFSSVSDEVTSFHGVPKSSGDEDERVIADLKSFLKENSHKEGLKRLFISKNNGKTTVELFDGMATHFSPGTRVLRGDGSAFKAALEKALSPFNAKNLAKYIRDSKRPIETAVQLALAEFGGLAIKEAMGPSPYLENNKEIHKRIAMDYSIYLRQVANRIEKDQAGYQITIFNKIEDRINSGAAR